MLRADVPDLKPSGADFIPCTAAATEELYGKYIVEEYDKSYAVNIRNRFKADAKHIIVTNY